MHKAKKIFLQRNVPLIIAVLLLQGCKIDQTPDPFGFATQAKVTPDTLVESEPVTLSGMTVPAPLSITGGEYSIDGQAYRATAGAVRNNQQVRIRVRSSSESSGEVSATLTIGGVPGSFLVKTVNFSGRVEAEAASLIGGASTAADGAASKGKAVFLGGVGHGISIGESLDAQTLIVAYRSDTAVTLEASINGGHAGRITLRPTGGAYATASLIAAVVEDDVVAFSNPSGASGTYLDYVAFVASPFQAVSTLAETAPWTSDGTSVGPDGNIYVSGGPTGQQIYRITPAGDVSVFAAGLGSANGSDFDSGGNLYVADYQSSAVRKITPEGVITTFAASLDGPAGVWIDDNDNVFVSLFGANFSGSGATVLRITPDGSITTFATGGGLRDVIGIVGDDDGRVYASNWGGGQVFDITDGNVTLLAETGGSLNMICYSNGFVYLPSPSSALINRMTSAGTVERFVGSTTRQTIDGPLATADFMRPNSCDFSADGTVMYVMDRESGLLRQVDAGPP